MSMYQTTKETLARMDAALHGALATPLKKADGLTTGNGLKNYDLQPAARLMYPVLSPLRNSTPRVKGGGGDATHWKAITGVNIDSVSMGVSEGQRSGVISIETKDAFALYKTLGLENFVTDEAVLQGEGFDNLRAICTKNLLEAVIIGEEKVLLGGNCSMKLGKTKTPTLAAKTTGGSLAASTKISVICAALTFEGYHAANVMTGVKAKVTRENADGSKDVYGGGAAQKSDAANVTTGAGTTNSITAVVTPTKGAFAYAWFWGAENTEKLGAITTTSSVTITANAEGTQQAKDLPAEDWSANDLIIDGYLTQTIQNGGYFKTMPTTAGLTADKAAGIVEIDEAFRWFWDKYKASPDEIYVSAQELQNITQKVLENGGSNLIRFNFDASTTQAATLSAGTAVGSYLNKYTMSGGTLVRIVLHPNMPAGSILFRSTTMPYPVSNVANIAEVRCQQDYFQTEWPRKTRKYEYGVYATEAFALYAPFAFGVITNIADA